MNYRSHTLSLALLLSAPLTSFAAFCPTNFNQIHIGDSIEQVMQQCGKPDSQDETKKSIEGPQEWNYFIPQSVSNGGNSIIPVQGTLKTQISFDANGKAINISVNGIGVGATTICGTSIVLGETRDKVKSACGNPSFINKENSSGAAPAETKVTTFTYKGSTSSTLIFENGVLKEQK